ncbi:efflux RND transporter periplasmic adaptor subunit [Pseudoteredinibacter isoporae]
MPILILLAGAVLVFAVATMKPKSKPQPKEEPKPAEVEIVIAEPAEHQLSVHSQGTVAPRREISLVAEVSGRIVKVNPSFVAGGHIAAGEPLVEIDPRDYRFAVVQAKSQVAEAEQRLATERGQARQKKREWRNLGNDEANDLFLRKPQIAAAQASLDAARANLEKAELNLRRTKISVPFSGLVRSTSVDLGQYVGPGTQLGKAFDTSVVEIRLPLTDAEAGLVDLPLGGSAANQAGPNVELSGTVAGDQQTWQGRIVRTDASLDTRTRLYYAVAEIDSPYHPEQTAPLMVGLFVEAKIDGKNLSNVVELPRKALYKNNLIYRVSNDNKVQIDEVKVLKVSNDKVWVKGDIGAGDKIIAANQQYLSADKEVRVKGEEVLESKPSAAESVAGDNDARNEQEVEG